MKPFIAVLALFAAASAGLGDIIELHNGTKIECTIVLEDGKNVFYKTDGQTKSLAIEDISGIIRSNKTPAVPSPNPGKSEASKMPATPANPGPEAAVPGEDPRAPAVEKVKTELPVEPRRREVSRTSDAALDKLFDSLKTTCESLMSSTTEEEKTFYRMRAIILQKHINSCGFTAGRMALENLESIPISTWKQKSLYVGFLADLVSGCRDRDIVPFFWDDWMPINLERVQNANDKDFPLSLVMKIVADLDASFDNSYRSVLYRLAPYQYRGIQRYAVDKTEMGMPK